MSVFAQDEDGFGPDSLLGCNGDTEAVLTALKCLNPGLPLLPLLLEGTLGQQRLLRW